MEVLDNTVSTVTVPPELLFHLFLSSSVTWEVLLLICSDTVVASALFLRSVVFALLFNNWVSILFCTGFSLSSDNSLSIVIFAFTLESLSSISSLL